MENDDVLQQLVVTQWHILINHAMITDTSMIHIRLIFIIWTVKPQSRLILWLYHAHIKAGKVSSRRVIVLCPDMLYDGHHADDCK